MHNVYQWSGRSIIAALFCPVNESVWEHMKLVFFPMLLFGCLLVPAYRTIYPCILPTFLVSTLLGTILLPVLYYTYTGITGGHFFAADIAVYILSITASFSFLKKYTPTCCFTIYTRLLIILTVCLTVCFWIYTFYPPDLTLFHVP